MKRLIVLFLLASAHPVSADVWTFETPSANVQCSVGEERDFADIECTIIQRQGAPALPRPAGCSLDWGHTFKMRDRGPVEMVCARLDRSRDGFSRAEYGDTGSFGGIQCSSSRKGLKCRNKDGNGFFLSRREQRLLSAAKTSQSNRTPFAEFDVSRDQIRDYQGRLNQLGFDAGAADGVPGERTRAAVRAFQKDRGFPVTGVLTNANVTRLIQDTHTQQKDQRTAKAVGYEEELGHQRRSSKNSFNGLASIPVLLTE